MTSHALSWTASLSGCPVLAQQGWGTDVRSDDISARKRLSQYDPSPTLRAYPKDGAPMPSMWHVFQANARFVPEARQSIDEIARFVAKHFR